MSSNATSNEPSAETGNPLVVENQRLRNKIIKLTTENVGLEKIISNKEKEVEIEKAKVTEKEKIINELNRTVSSYVERTNRLEELNVLSKNELAVKEKEIEVLKTDVETTKKELSENRDELLLTKAILDEISNDYSTQTKLLERKKKEIYELKKREEELQAVILKQQQEIEMKSKENSNLQTKLKAAAEVDLEKSKKLEKVQSELIEKILKAEELQKTLDEKINELEQMKADLSSKEKSLKEQRIELHHVRNNSYKQVEQSENMIAKLKKGEQEIRADFLECLQEFGLQRKINAELQVKLDLNVQEHKRELENVQKTLSELQLKLELIEKEKSSLSAEMELEKQTVNNLQFLLKYCVLERDSYKDQTAKSKDTISALEKQLLEYEKNIHDSEAKISNQQIQLNALKLFIDEDHKYRAGRLEKYKTLSDTVSPSSSSIAVHKSDKGADENIVETCSDLILDSKEGNRPETEFLDEDDSTHTNEHDTRNTTANNCDVSAEQELTFASGHASIPIRDIGKRKLDTSFTQHGATPPSSNDVHFCICGKKFDSEALLKSHLDHHRHLKESDK